MTTPAQHIRRRDAIKACWPPDVRYDRQTPVETGVKRLLTQMVIVCRQDATALNITTQELRNKLLELTKMLTGYDDHRGQLDTGLRTEAENARQSVPTCITDTPEWRKICEIIHRNPEVMSAAMLDGVDPDVVAWLRNPSNTMTINLKR